MSNDMIEFYIPTQLDVLMRQFKQSLYQADKLDTINLSSWRSWKT